MKYWFSVSVNSNNNPFVGLLLTFKSRSSFLSYKVTFLFQIDMRWQIKYRWLSKKEIFSDVLLMISIFHFLLVNIIDKLFNLILSTASSPGLCKPCGWSWLLVHILMSFPSKKLSLEDRRKFRHFKVLAVFYFIRNTMKRRLLFITIIQYSGTSWRRSNRVWNCPCILIMLITILLLLKCLFSLLYIHFMILLFT